MEQLKNFFKFLEDKEGKNPPLRYKFIHDPESLTPEDLNIKGNLDLRYTPITSLPDNLKVGGDLYLWNTRIISLPNNLQVGMDLYIYYTPLAKKYTKEEIKRMIEDKEGKVKGEVYV